MNKIATGSSELPSSVNAVVSNDDLLIEVLLRLPIVSLLVVRSVSKRWLTLITNPNFTLRRSQTQSPILDPPSGLFLQQQQSFFKYDFVSLDARIPANISVTLGSDSGKLEILQSCNSLFLCRIRRDDTLYVCNPCINQFKMIPGRYDSELIRMAFDPSKSPHYKIVYAKLINGSSIEIHTYSSETLNWSVCGDRFPFDRFRDFDHGIYWNGAIHWINKSVTAFYCKLDVEHPTLTNLITPGRSVYHDRKLFESSGSLLLLCTKHEHPRQLIIYEMTKCYPRWSIKYTVDLVDIMIQFPETLRNPPAWFFSRVRCIMVGSTKEDQDSSFLVMDINGKIVQYNIVLKTRCTLYESKSVHSPNSFQFIASLASV